MGNKTANKRLQPTALRTVGDRLIETLYAVLRPRRPCNEAYHLRMESLQGKPVQY